MGASRAATSRPPRSARSAASGTGSATSSPELVADLKTTEFTVRTGAKRGLFDLTEQCAAFVRDSGDGLLNIYVPHATAGLVVMELGAGSDRDLLATLDALLPRDERWRHRHGSAGHGADHVLPLLVPPSLSVPVKGGALELGTWQSIALLDPNPDNDARRIVLTFLSG